MPRVTIKDIARRAGVSKTAVSFAFNNPDQLADSTVERILQVAEELGYHPHPVASNLKTQRTGCIGLLVPQPLPEIARNPHLLDLLEGIGQVAHHEGMSVMLVPPLKGSLQNAVARAAVDGFLTLGLESFRDTMRIIRQRQMPFVMIDSDPLENVSGVNTDDESGAYLAMREVLQAGHRQILIIGILSDKAAKYWEYHGTVRRRIDGYLRALSEFGLTIDSKSIHLIEADASMKGGELALMSIWESDWHPTAVVTMADVIALGVIHAAQNLGLNLPYDLSIVGYDDIEASRSSSPPLTTIRQPTVRKGETAARILMEQINSGKRRTVEHVVLPVAVVRRQSVRQIYG
jgi:alanine racemase